MYQLPQCWDYSCVPPYMVYSVLEMRPGAYCMLYMNPASRVRFIAPSQPLTFRSWHLLGNIGSELLGGHPVLSVYLVSGKCWHTVSKRSG